MTHNSREGDTLEELINDIRRSPDTDSVHIHEYVHQELQKAQHSLHTSLVAAVKEKAYKPWDHYNDIPGEEEMVKLEDLLTIINSIFKE